nr:PREDICTED: adhesion G-protein coupled receptor G7 [Latimeria chalumnae]|eukprot:XP_014343759.1 PREDICTED: adhesion G-protein coupled receptor G7 [Latimeria chalumnae]
MDVHDDEFSPDNADVSNVTKSLTKSLEKFSMEVNNNASKLVQSNLAVQSLSLGQGVTQGVLFTALRGLNDNLLGNRIELNSNASNLTENTYAEVQIFINVSTSQVDQGRVGFVLYQNDKFFKSKTHSSKMNFTKRVISGNLANNVTLNSVELLFNPQNYSSEFYLYDYACVFWDYNIDDWNTTGCTKGKVDNGPLRCWCNHTTNFALLMNFRQNYKYAQPLEIVSYVGCGLSIAGLALTILFQVSTRKTRKTSITWMFVSLCVSMLIVNVIFISGIDNPNAKKDHGVSNSTENTLIKSDLSSAPEEVWCTLVAAFLHYFLLATFTWTALYAVHMHFLLTKIFKQPPRHLILKASGIGWGVPAVVVAITLGATYGTGNPLNYRQEEFCWLAALDPQGTLDLSKPMLWTFLLPLGIILILNFIVFVNLTVMVQCKNNKILNR